MKCLLKCKCRSLQGKMFGVCCFFKCISREAFPHLRAQTQGHTKTEPETHRQTKTANSERNKCTEIIETQKRKEKEEKKTNKKTTILNRGCHNIVQYYIKKCGISSGPNTVITSLLSCLFPFLCRFHPFTS